MQVLKMSILGGLIGLSAIGCGRLIPETLETNQELASTKKSNEFSVPVTMTQAEATQFALLSGGSLVGADYALDCSNRSASGRLIGSGSILNGTITFSSADSSCVIKVLAIDYKVSGESVYRRYHYNRDSSTDLVQATYAAGTADIFRSSGGENDDSAEIYLRVLDDSTLVPSSPTVGQKLMLAVVLGLQARDGKNVVLESTPLSATQSAASVGVLSNPFELNSIVQGTDNTKLKATFRCDSFLEGDSKCAGDASGVGFSPANDVKICLVPQGHPMVDFSLAGLDALFAGSSACSLVPGSALSASGTFVTADLSIQKLNGFSANQYLILQAIDPNSPTAAVYKYWPITLSY